ncbi:transposase [Mannheimia sp. E30BD]|uniref:REP-associated tyrosine transposase n=1 Tax=Mannheimia sp. E30BD TaxID=3278708 RepID=UPI00359D76AE
MPNYRRDFTKGGLYFFTVVLENRQADFLIRYIHELRSAFSETQKYYPFKIIAICILPDHLHMIIQLPEGDQNYSRRIQSIKRNFSMKLPQQPSLNESRVKRKELTIWQRRFWEHLIRDEKDLANHMDYIYYNPVKHGYVKFVKDWQYSSFHRDVKQGIYPQYWGGNPDLMIKGEI